MFLNELKDIAWQSAQIVEEYNPARIRKDACGAWIAYADFNNLQQPLWMGIGSYLSCFASKVAECTGGTVG